MNPKEAVHKADPSEQERAIKGIGEIVPLLRKISEEDWVKAIRETRDER